MARFFILRFDDRATLLVVVEAADNAHAREVAAAMLPGYAEADLMSVRDVREVSR